MSAKTRLMSAISFVKVKHNKVSKIENKETIKVEEFDWQGAIADALIIAGMQFFYTLAGMSAAQITSDPVKTLLAATISAGLGFFTTLALKRGLKTSSR